MRTTVHHNTQEKTNVDENSKQKISEIRYHKDRKARISNTQAEPIGGKRPPTGGETAYLKTDHRARTGTASRGKSGNKQKNDKKRKYRRGRWNKVGPNNKGQTHIKYIL
jgi:hypothetical protein